MPSRTGRAVTSWTWLLLPLVMGLSAWRDLAYLFSSPYPYGIDGYYYLAQVSALAETGSLFKPAAPLAFAFIWLAGCIMTAPAAIKVSGVVFLYTASLVGFMLVQRVTRSMLVGTVAAALLLHGFLRVESLVNFLKQSCGQAAVLGLLLTLTWWWERPSRWRAILPATCLAMALLSHKLAAILAVSVLAGFVLSGFLGRRSGAVGLTLFNIVAVAGIWTACYLMARNNSRTVLDSVTAFFDTTPRFQWAVMWDSFGDLAPVVPRAGLLTVLLLAGVLFHVTRCIGAARAVPSDDGNSDRLLLVLGCSVLPMVVLAFCPWLVSAIDDPYSLQLRLLPSLSIAAALFIPFMLQHVKSDKARGVTCLLLLAVLCAPPPFWAGFTGPPVDNGALHEAMVEAGPKVPGDAVILTDLIRGNMVNALWRRQRILVDAAPMDEPHRNWYRLTLLSPDTQDALLLFSSTFKDEPYPLVVHGPWTLVREDLYSAFHAEKPRPAIREQESANLPQI